MQIEVIAGHQPLGAVEPEPRHPVRAVLLRRVEHPPELPGLPDRHHLGPAGPLRSVQVRPDHLQLPVAPAEHPTTHGTWFLSAYRRTAARNPWLILSSAAGEAIGNPRQPSHPATCPDVCRA